MQNQLVDTTLANPSLLNFMFENHEIRLAASSSDLWVWAAGQDVFAGAGLAWNGRNSIEKLPKEWVKVLKVHTVKGEKEAIFIAEPGIYYILSRSNKPKPLALFRWVFEDVLPSIRANGYFGTLSGADRSRISRELRQTLAELPKADAFSRELLLREIRCLCGLLGYRMPDTRLIGKDPDQLALEGF